MVRYGELGFSIGEIRHNEIGQVKVKQLFTLSEIWTPSSRMITHINQLFLKGENQDNFEPNCGLFHWPETDTTNKAYRQLLAETTTSNQQVQHDRYREVYITWYITWQYRVSWSEDDYQTVRANKVTLKVWNLRVPVKVCKRPASETFQD